MCEVSVGTINRYNSMSEDTGLIRDSFINLGIFYKQEKKYQEAYEYWKCADKIRPSMLSSYSKLEILCNIKDITEDKIVGDFNRALKEANSKNDSWEYREDFRDTILNIQSLGNADINNKVAIIIKEIKKHENFYLSLKKQRKVTHPKKK